MKTVLIAVVTSLLNIAGVSPSFAQMSIVNGASFDPAQPIAIGSFASIFGQNLCANSIAGDWVAPGQLPTSLGGCSVTVNGIPAMLHYVSVGQINFLMPAGVGSGQASVYVNNGSQIVTGAAATGTAGPGVFALNGMGMGEGAMVNATMGSIGTLSTATNGGPTYVSIYLTGLDPSSTPTISIGGVAVDVMWFGNAPGYVGLQQMNFLLPSGMAGVGRVPVTVTSNGQVSNVTFMHVLPTNGMMQGMPGWGQGMTIGENMRRGHEMSSMAYNAANGTVLVSDENNDAVRVISLGSNSTSATISLPSGSQAHAIAVNAAGTLAAVGLSDKASVALLDLIQNKLVSVIGTGNYPSRMVFSGSNLLVTNAGSATVSVIDTTSKTVAQTVAVGLGASGIAVAGNTAIVANLLAGSISIINLATYAVLNLSLPAGSRPHEVAISAQGNKAVITTPMTNTFLILDLGTKTFTQVATGPLNGMGQGAVVLNGNAIYIANQMAASVIVADLASASVVKTFTVDPGPIALAVNSNKNQLLVLAEGTGTLDLVDLGSFQITQRINVADTERQGQFAMPSIASISPNNGAVGATLTLTIVGNGFTGTRGVEFLLAGSSGMMGGGQGGLGQADTNIKVSNIQIDAAGTKLTASVQILANAAIGVRQIRLQTDFGTMMGQVTNSPFTVTK